LRDDLKAAEQRKGDIKNFIKATKKYTDLKELDAAVLREFVEKIYVHEKDKESKTQEIQIVYNFIGVFDFEGASEISKNVSPAEKRSA
jgi:isocitrate/isopropylmalate dehydrogenase